MLQGEFGFLKEVLYDPNRRGRMLLKIEHNAAEYLGCLVFEDVSFCQILEKHLRGYYGMPVETIGSSELP
jgi:hypothetical protein